MKLIVVRGFPGSGKSTFAKSLNIFHIEVDMFFTCNGKFEWDSEKSREYHSECMTFTRLALRIGMDVVVSNVFARIREVEAYMELAKEYNATFELYRTVGDYGNIHEIPPDGLKYLQNAWQNIPGERIVKF